MTARNRCILWSPSFDFSVLGREESFDPMPSLDWSLTPLQRVTFLMDSGWPSMKYVESFRYWRHPDRASDMLLVLAPKRVRSRSYFGWSPMKKQLRNEDNRCDEQANSS